jgi:hypothetical protein
MLKFQRYPVWKCSNAKPNDSAVGYGQTKPSVSGMLNYANYANYALGA